MFKITKWCKCITDSGKDEVLAEKPIALNCHFRLLDDDKNIYGYGYSDSDNDEKAFEPLDYYEPRYGCVEIQYQNPKTMEWETL